MNEDRYSKALTDFEHGTGGGEALEVAMDCIRARIPKVPTSYIEKEDVCDLGQCPICYSFANSDMNFCDQCGQRLKWKK